MSTNVFGYVNSEDPRWGDSSPLISDDNTDAINIPIHGNCPKCRHLHTSTSFTFPKDPTKHTRFECEECGHQIFGIGRSSTQTTLASVETLPTSRRNSGTTRLPTCICVNAPPLLPDLRVGTPRSPEQITLSGHLTPIAEINTLGGRSRSTSLQGPNRASPGREAVWTGDTSRAIDNTISGTGDARQAHQQPSGIKGILHRLRNKKRLHTGNVHQPVKRMKFLGFQISVTRIPHQHHRPSLSPGQDVAEPRNPDSLNLAIPLARNPETFDIRPVRGNQTNKTPTQARENDEPRTNTDSSRPSTGLMNLGGSTMEDSLGETERNRVKARRQEKTLKSEAASRPRCECLIGCPCLGDGHISDDSSGHSRVSLPASQVPDHRIHGISNTSNRSACNRTSQVPSNSVHLAGIGNHFITNGGTSTEGSSSATASQIHLNRLSMTTTTWGSNDSDHSLPYGRPTGGRSSSMSILLHRRPRVQHDPIGQSRLVDSLLRNEGFGSPTNIEANSDENLIEVASPRASTTSLSQLPGTEPESEQIQPIDDDETSSSLSHTLSVDNELEPSSQERTPRPQSQNERLDDPATLSSARDPLAETLENLVPSEPPTRFLILESESI